jgi:hypothetical protein
MRKKKTQATNLIIQNWWYRWNMLGFQREQAYQDWSLVVINIIRFSTIFMWYLCIVLRWTLLIIILRYQNNTIGQQDCSNLKTQNKSDHWSLISYEKLHSSLVIW